MRQLLEDFPTLKEEALKHPQHYWSFITISDLHDMSNGGNVLDCERGNDGDCGNEGAKELRFCSVVFYTAPYEGAVVLCAMMTNFLE